MQYDGSIRINTKLNTKEFETGINGILSGMKRISRSLNEIMKSFGFAIGIASLVALGKKAIDTASDIQEVQNVVDTAFGSMSHKMEEFAKNSVKQFGISQLSAKQLGSTFMAMGKSMVGDMETASNMAINLTARAADMASFYNKSVQETSTALKSIYTGETESLKEYGVVMTQVNLQEFAYRQGINKKISAMNQAEKVQLQYAYVMEQTSLAAGDFARTSDSWANQTRILSEQFKELLSILGGGLIAALTPVVKFLNTILTQLIVIAKQISAILSRLVGVSIPTANSDKLAENLSAAAGGANDLAEGMDAAGKSAEKAGKAAKGALAPFDDLNVLAKETASSGGAGISGGGGGAGVNFEDMFEESQVESGFEEMADKAKEIFLSIFEPFKQAWESQGKFVMDSWKYALEEIGLLAKSVGSDFLEVWNQPETISMLENMLIIVGDIGIVAGNLARNFRLAWDENDTGKQILETIRDIISGIVEHIRNMADSFAKFTDELDFSPLLESVLRLLESLEPFADNVGAGLEWFWNNVLLPIAGWVIEDAIPVFLDMLAASLDLLNSVLESFKPLGEWLWNNFLQPIGEWAGETFISAMNTVVDLLEKLSDWVSENPANFQAMTVTALAFLSAFQAPAAITGITSLIGILGKLGTTVSTLASGGLLAGAGTLSKLANVFALTAGGAGTLNESLTLVFGTVTTMVAGIGSIVLGAITAVTNFFSMLQDGFSWLNEALMLLGISLAAIGAVILGAPALVAGIVAAVVAAAATIVVIVHDNWDAICQWFSGVADWINENVIQPVIAFFKSVWDSVSGFFSGLWNDIVGIWSAAAGWFSSNVIEPVVNFFQGLWTRVQQIFEGLWIIIQAIWIVVSEWFNTNVIIPIVGFFQGLWESVSGFFTSLWEDIVAVWELVSGWFNENVIIPVTDFFKGVWDNVSEFFSNLWKDIQAVWVVVAGWFNENIITPVQKAFKAACDEIGGFFSGLWDGIKRGVVSAMNAVIGGIETAINWIVDGINMLIGGFNKIVSWAAKVAEVDWGGVDLVPKVSLSRVPALATGAVIRGGNPFMAILGDQPAGQVNVEAPLDTIKQAVREELSSSNIGGNGGGTLQVVLNVNGEDLARATLSDWLSEMNRQGYDVSVLGVT